MATVGPSRPVNLSGAQPGAGASGSYQVDPSLLWGSGYYNTFGGSLMPGQLPIFRASDIYYNPAQAGGRTETESGSIESGGTPASWGVNGSAYGGSFLDNTAFVPDTTNVGPNGLLNSFAFGVKSGHDQGRLAGYTLQTGADGQQYYVPTQDYGTVGGRHGLFDSNAYTRDNNITAAKNLASFLAMGYGAYLGAGAEGAGTSAEYLSAADQAGGLVPQYGTNAAYEAGLAGGGGTSAATVPQYGSPGYEAGTPSSAPEYGSPGYNAGNGSGTPSGTAPNSGTNPFGNMKGSDWVKLGTTAYGLLGGGNNRGNGSVAGGGMLNYTGAPMASLGQVMGAPPQYTMPTQPTIDPRTPAADMYAQYMQGLSQPMGLLNGGGGSMPQKPTADPTLLGNPYARPVTRTGPYGG